jgi:hypothetical protein
VTVFDARLESYESRDRFAEAVLGLLSLAEHTRALALVPRQTPGRAEPSAVADLFLGLISLGYTTRALLGCAPAVAAGESADAPPSSPSSPSASSPSSDRLLR